MKLALYLFISRKNLVHYYILGFYPLLRFFCLSTIVIYNYIPVNIANAHHNMPVNLSIIFEITPVLKALIK